MLADAVVAGDEPAGVDFVCVSPVVAGRDWFCGGVAAAADDDDAGCAGTIACVLIVCCCGVPSAGR